MKNGKHIFKISVRAAFVFLFVFALPDGVAAQAVSFLARRDFTFRGGPMAVGDFNRDGIQDLFSTNVGTLPPLVEVLLGNGDGTFHPAMISGVVESMPLSVAVGDFNGDGIQDLAMGVRAGASILIGNGDGTFQAGQAVTFSRFPRSIAIGDFNRDGFQDLAIASSRGSGALSGDALIVLGNGDGTFQPAQAFRTGSDPNSVAIGDFNGDGLQDLAVATSIDVSILLGDGDGTFQPAAPGAKCLCSSVAIGDFNGDGVQDLAVTNRDSNDGSVLLGNGNGTFQSARTFGTGESPNSVAIGDFNGDRIQDLAVVNSGSDHVSILLGNGDGSFQPAENLGTGSAPSSVAIGDFNGDGIQDLTWDSSGDVSIVLGNGNGSFRSERNFAAGHRPRSVAVGDFNNDRVQDLAVTNWVLTTTGSVSILLGDGYGTFQPPLSFEARRFPESIAVGEFNGDGFQDLAVANSGSSGPEAPIISIFFGNGDGTFQPAQDIGPVDRARSVAVGDFNRDGRQDLAVVHDGSLEADIVSILLGSGNGAFQPAQDLITGRGSSRSVAIGDFNHDGIQDLAVSNQFSQSVSILLGNGNGTFQPSREFELRRMPTSVAVGDFNGDGIQDLALSNRAFGDPDRVPIASILLGNGDGTFQPVQEFGPENRADSIVVSDFNGDGKQDLVTVSPLSDNVSVLLGNGDGTFQEAGNFGAGDEANFLAVGDFNKDGAPDLVVANLGSDNVSVLINKTESQRTLKVVNAFVSFQPRLDTFRTTTDPTLCPGFVGTFRFDATLTNKSSSPRLSDLVVRVVTLTDGNLLQNAAGGSGGAGAILPVPLREEFSDGVLSPQEVVDMPFVVCLKNTEPFNFLVNVLGTEAGNINNSLASK